MFITLRYNVILLKWIKKNFLIFSDSFFHDFADGDLDDESEFGVSHVSQNFILK